MMMSNKAGLLSVMAMLMLLMAGLIGCSQDSHYLRGNQVIRLQQNESAPWQGWLIQDEALARILEKAESCQNIK